MQVGDLVQIGWNGKAKEPFIGTVVELSKYSDCCWVLVNGKKHCCSRKGLRKWKPSKSET